MKQKIIMETSTLSEKLICNHQKSQKTVKQFHFPHQQKTLKTVISSGNYTNQSDEKYVSRASTTTPLTAREHISSSNYLRDQQKSILFLEKDASVFELMRSIR